MLPGHFVGVLRLELTNFELKDPHLIPELVSTSPALLSRSVGVPAGSAARSVFHVCTRSHLPWPVDALGLFGDVGRPPRDVDSDNFRIRKLTSVREAAHMT